MAIYKMSQITRMDDPLGDMGERLADLCEEHFEDSYAKGSGVGYGSCCAAVPVTSISSQGWRQEWVARDAAGFSVVFGNSQMFRGLDHSNEARLIARNSSFIDEGNEHLIRSNRNPHANSPLEQHAEQSAILMAEYEKFAFYTIDHLCFVYVDLAPCPSCRSWLERRPEEWYVFYKFDYSSAGNSALLIEYRTQRFGKR